MKNELTLNNVMTIAILAIMALMFIGIVGVVMYDGSITLNNQNSELCHEYAEKSHQKEFTPERWKIVEQMHWTTQMWYDACIQHIIEPVAK